METTKIRRIGEIKIGTERSEGDDYHKITSLIRDDRWELHEITLHMQAGRMVYRVTLAHDDSTAAPSDFGWEPLIKPAQ